MVQMTTEQMLGGLFYALRVTGGDNRDSVLYSEALLEISRLRKMETKLEGLVKVLKGT